MGLDRNQWIGLGVISGLAYIIHKIMDDEPNYFSAESFDAEKIFEEPADEGQCVDFEHHQWRYVDSADEWILMGCRDCEGKMWFEPKEWMEGKQPKICDECRQLQKYCSCNYCDECGHNLDYLYGQECVDCEGCHHTRGGCCSCKVECNCVFEDENNAESFEADDIYGVCPFCGYDAEAAVKYQMKQNDEELTDKEYDEEVKFYLYESHPDFCKPMQKYVEDNPNIFDADLGQDADVDSFLYVGAKDYSNEIVENLNPLLRKKLGKTFLTMNTQDDSWMFRLTGLNEKLEWMGDDKDEFIEYLWENEAYGPLDGQARPDVTSDSYPHPHGIKYVGFDWKDRGNKCIKGFNIPLKDIGYELRRIDELDPSRYELVKIS